MTSTLRPSCFFYLFKGFVVAGQADGHPGNGIVFRHADGQAVQIVGLPGK